MRTRDELRDRPRAHEIDTVVAFGRRHERVRDGRR
jgi:hypothetical protein